MIPIFPILIVVIMVLLSIFSVNFRNRIADISGGAADYAVGSWHWFRNNVWPAIQTIFGYALLIGGIGWLILVVLLGQVGAYANSPISAKIVSIIFPIWFAAFIMPPIASKIWILGKIIDISKGKILTTILVISTIFLLVGIWSPVVKGSWNRWAKNQKQEMADKFDESSTKTEGKLGKIGRVDYAGVHGYKEVDGTLFTANLQKGKYVRLVTEIPGQKLSKASGGMVWVMLQNDQGDFVRGSLWMVHPHKVNWDWQQQDAAAKALAEVERAAKAQAEAAKVEATKEAAKEAAQKAAAKKAAEENLSGEWTLRYSDKFSEKTVTVEVNENNLIITSGQVVFQGRKTENCKYEGKWFNGKTMNQGRFALAFINKEQANGRFVSKDGEIFPIFMKKK